MEYLHSYKDYKIYKQGDLFYALKSYGKKITANQVSYDGVKKYVAPSMELLSEMIDNTNRKQIIKLEQLNLF